MNLSKETPESRLNPFISIWTKPRQTVRQMIEEKNSRLIFLLVVLSGYTAILTTALDTDADETFGIPGLLIGGLIISPLLGAIGLAIGSLISILVGKIFKGTATFDEMYRAQLAGQIPQMWLIPVLLIWIFFLPSSYFKSFEEQYSGMDLGLNIVLSVILFVLSMCTLFYQSKAIGEAHGLSAWKGFFIILIPIAAVIVLLSLIFVPMIFSL